MTYYRCPDCDEVVMHEIDATPNREVVDDVPCLTCLGEVNGPEAYRPLPLDPKTQGQVKRSPS